MKVSVTKKKLYTDHERYVDELLGGLIQFEEIPICALRGMHCSSIYTTVFRLDRSISKEQYRKHMDFLRDEVTFAWRTKCKPLSDTLASIYYRQKIDFEWLFNERYC